MFAAARHLSPPVPFSPVRFADPAWAHRGTSLDGVVHRLDALDALAAREGAPSAHTTTAIAPTPQAKPAAAAARYRWNNKVGTSAWFHDTVRHKPAHPPAPPPHAPRLPTPRLPTPVAALRVQVTLGALDEGPQAHLQPARGQPKGELAQTVFDYAHELRDDLVYARHLAHAAPQVIKQGLVNAVEPIRTLWRGGPHAQQLVQDMKDGVHLLLNDFDSVATAVGHAVAQEQDHIATLKRTGQLDEAAQRELDLGLNALGMAMPGVGALWASGRVALATGHVARAVGRLRHVQGSAAQGSVRQAIAKVSRHKAGFIKSVKAGTMVAAAGAVGSAALSDDAVKIYFDRRSHQIPATLYGAPRDVKALTVKVGPMSASLWGGTHVTVGNPIGTAEVRRAGKRKRAQNQVVNEQHQTGVLLGAGLHFGTNHAAAYGSRMLQLFNVTTTGRADPTAESKALTRLATQADVSWIYWNSTDALALGPIALKGRKTQKGKHAAGALSNDGRGRLGTAAMRESKYKTANPNPAFGKPALESYAPSMTFNPLGWLTGNTPRK